MTSAAPSRLPELVSRNAKPLLASWLAQQRASSAARLDLIGDSELDDQSKRFLASVEAGLKASSSDDPSSAAWIDARELLREISRSRAIQGFSPNETASFVFSLKQPLFDLVRRELGAQPQQVADETWRISLIVDQLGLFTMESFQQSRRPR